MTPLPQPVLAPQAPSDEELAMPSEESMAEIARDVGDEDKHCFIFNKDGRFSIHSYGREVVREFCRINALALGRAAPTADLRATFVGPLTGMTIAELEDAAAQLAAVAAPEARIEGQKAEAWLRSLGGKFLGDGIADSWRASDLLAALVHPAAPGSSTPSAAPLSEPCALDQGARPVWQPIETAPKDSTPVIVWCDGCVVGEARFVQNDPDESGAWWWANEGPGDYHAEKLSPEPTHWMPLPPAPAGIAPPVDQPHNPVLTTAINQALGNYDLNGQQEGSTQ